MIVASFPGSGEEPGNEANEHVFLQLIIIVVNQSTMTNLNLRASVVIRCCMLQEMIYFWIYSFPS